MLEEIISRLLIFRLEEVDTEEVLRWNLISVRNFGTVLRL